MRSDDEIVEAIRRRRDAHAALLNYDLKRITEEPRRREQASPTGIVSRFSRKPLATPKSSWA